MEKIGILGGTFDPPHNGHLLIAQEVLSALSLDEIWFLPTNVPPHKRESTTSGEARIEMVKLAIETNDKFVLKTIEFERNGPSYTIDTIKILKETFPNTEFYFIIGGDMIEYLPKWDRIDQLVKMISFVGVGRPGFSFHSEYPIIKVDIPQFDVSSSMVRHRYKNEKNTKYFLPDNVRLYIEEKNLYGSQESTRNR